MSAEEACPLRSLMMKCTLERRKEEQEHSDSLHIWEWAVRIQGSEWRRQTALGGGEGEELELWRGQWLEGPSQPHYKAPG
jgi:hypothetical protein